MSLVKVSLVFILGKTKLLYLKTIVRGRKVAPMKHSIEVQVPFLCRVLVHLDELYLALATFAAVLSVTSH